MQDFIFFTVSLVFNFYLWTVFLRILLIAYQIADNNPLNRFVAKLTDLPVGWIGRLIPKFGWFDTGALLLLVIVDVIKLLVLLLLVGVSHNIFGVAAAMVSDLTAQILNLYFYMILVIVLVHWLSPQQDNTVLDILRKFTSPILSIAARVMPKIKGFDYSPIVVLVFIKVIDLCFLMPLLRFDGLNL